MHGNNMGNFSARGRQVPARIRLFQVVLLIVTSIITYGALVLPELLLQTAVPLQPGDVSPSDFQAPHSLDYISKIGTEDARRRRRKPLCRSMHRLTPESPGGRSSVCAPHWNI